VYLEDAREVLGAAVLAGVSVQQTIENQQLLTTKKWKVRPPL